MQKINGFDLFVDFSIKEYLEQLKKIKSEIIFQNILTSTTNEKDIKIFKYIIKNFGKKYMYNIYYISKKKSKLKIHPKLSKNFLMNKISLLFMFFYMQTRNYKISKEEDINIYEWKFKRKYKILFNLIDNLYNSELNNNESIIDVGDVFEIIRLNLLLGLNDLINKSYIFNESINYLINFFFDNESNINIQSYLNLIISQIHTNLLNSQKNLSFLRRDKNLDNLKIMDITKFLFYSNMDDHFVDSILEILCLIYLNNYSSLISDYILDNIKECFYELKENNNDKILRSVRNLKGFSKFLDALFEKEVNEKYDSYRPSSYFVFLGNESSGIKYTPNLELLKKSFTIIFSFKANEIKENVIYPLITYIDTFGKNDIMFNLSILNDKLHIYCQGDNNLREIGTIYLNNSYLVIVEYKISGLIKSKIKIYVNDSKYEVPLGNINHKAKCTLKIGYLTKTLISNNNKIFKNVNNFIGIMGPIIQFSCIFDEKNFIQNILNLKGNYDLILLMNKNANLNYNHDYEEFQYFSDNDINVAKKYFSEYTKKINEEFLLSICPISMINNQDTYFFCQDIYNKNIKGGKDIFPDFITLTVPNSKTLATYAKKNQKSLSTFVEYDGISIYTLIIEYLYNILRMLINNPKEEKIELCNEMFNILCIILKNFFKILGYFKLDNFEERIDSFGFSLKKLFNLLSDIQPLNDELINTIIESGIQLLEYYEKLFECNTKTYILNFLSKFISLIFSPKFLVISKYSKSKIFEFMDFLIQKNQDLINKYMLKELLSFSFILNPNSFDEYNNKRVGTTLKTNEKYKKLKKIYKKLIITFIQNADNLKLYYYYIKYIFSNPFSSWNEKYQLIKIYYKNHIVKFLYNDNKNKASNKSRFNSKKGKNNINNILTRNELLNEYKTALSKLVEIIPQKEKNNEYYFELSKTFLILLIYEHEYIIPLNIYNESKESLNSKEKRKENLNFPFKNEDGTKVDINFFSSNSLDQIKNQSKSNVNISFNNSLSDYNLSLKYVKSEEMEISNDKLSLDNFSEEKEDINQSFELSENKSFNNNKESSLFDTFLNSKNFSMYTIKGIFSCLCDKWDNEFKIQFIKNEKEEEPNFFSDCISNFDRYTKKLFYQFLCLLEYINDENIIKKSLKILFSFITNIIKKYIEDLSNKSKKILFLHLLESKTIMNKLLIFCLNNEILSDIELQNFIFDSIKFINNNAIIYHPKPFIFSLIKNLVKSENPYINLIIDFSCKSIVDFLKSHDSVLYYCLFNSIRFINTLIKLLNKNPDNFKKSLMENNFELFYCIQKFTEDMLHFDIAFDPNLYVINPSIIYHKKREKKENKIFQSSSTKLLNQQVIFLELFQISLNLIYQLWKLQDEDKKIINIAIDYINKIKNAITIKGNYIGYFLDTLNSYFKINNKYLATQAPDNIKNKLINDLNDGGSKNKIHYSVRESKIVSFSMYLILMKYYCLLINYEKSKGDNNNESLITNAFQELISSSEKEIMFLLTNIKVLPNANLEIMVEREESRSKEFKDFNKNYYKYFMEKLKIKNFDLNSIKEELQNKFIEDENEKTKISINLLKTETNNNYNDSKIEKKGKLRKDSFGEYSDEKDLEEDKKKNNKSNKENKNHKELNIINNNEKPLLDFETAKCPILCTKRDLILKNFGYFYYKYYFQNNKFIKLRKLFLYKNNPNNKFNNYHGFEKTMKNNFPFTSKNFSNNNSYYPRIFFKPYRKFFENKYFSISHPYFKNEQYNKSNREKIMHLEYGHGLLNQPTFDIYSVSNRNKSEEMNESMSSSFSKGSEDENLSNLESLISENVNQNKSQIFLNNGTFTGRNAHQSYTVKNKSNLLLQNIKTMNQRIFCNKIYNKDEINIVNNSLKFECEKISTKNTCNGYMFFKKNFLIFQSNIKFDIKKYDENPFYLISCSKSDLEQYEKQIIIPYNCIYQIILRKFLFYDVAIEIFLLNGKSYFFNFYSVNNKNKFIKIMSEKIKDDIIIKNSVEYFEKNRFLNKWVDGTLPTLNYLLLINKFSDRSYNVLSQYLILPWLFLNFDNIYNSENIRNFNTPWLMKFQEKKEQKKKEGQKNEFKSHFPNLYSNYMYSVHYLFRLYPYINCQIKLQENRFDAPTRQFYSIFETYNIFKDNPELNMELIPEFYFIPEFFLNINYCNYGIIKVEDEEHLINNLEIGPCFHQILEIINYHQTNINSENIYPRINKWIDYVFGESQLSTKKDSIYNFPRVCYEKFVKEDIDEEFKKILSLKKGNSKLELNIQNINNNENIDSLVKESKLKIKGIFYKTFFYGNCPTQIFVRNHPTLTKKAEHKIYNFSDIKNLEITLKNELLILEPKEFLFIQESSKGTYFYVVCEHEILVYNKNLKLNNHLSINYISKFPRFNPIKYHKDENYFKLFHNYKYLIFDIFDCKYFFVGGYADNSLRIYYKEKDKVVMYFLYTNSQIKSIRKSQEVNIFFTGHDNGKIVKWRINNEGNQFNIIKENSIRGHKSAIKMLELNDKYECIISVDVDEMIFIRKSYDFELLSYIKINKYNKKIIDININNQIILLTIFKTKKNEICIYSYTLNGLKLAKISEKLKLPLTIIPNTDEMIIFNIFNIYIAKVAFNEKASIVTISNNFEISNKDVTLVEDNDISYCFNEDLQKNEAISYFYDIKNRVLFCLFSNGFLYRINFVKNA